MQPLGDIFDGDFVRKESEQAKNGNFSCQNGKRERRIPSVFLWLFSVMPNVENMSVLPTNAAVFYGIFIDKDVDNF